MTRELIEPNKQCKKFLLKIGFSLDPTSEQKKTKEEELIFKELGAEITAIESQFHQSMNMREENGFSQLDMRWYRLFQLSFSISEMTLSAEEIKQDIEGTLTDSLSKLSTYKEILEINPNLKDQIDSIILHRFSQHYPFLNLNLIKLLKEKYQGALETVKIFAVYCQCFPKNHLIKNSLIEGITVLTLALCDRLLTIASLGKDISVIAPFLKKLIEYCPQSALYDVLVSVAEEEEEEEKNNRVIDSLLIALSMAMDKEKDISAFIPILKKLIEKCPPKKRYELFINPNENGASVFTLLCYLCIDYDKFKKSKIQALALIQGLIENCPDNVTLKKLLTSRDEDEIMAINCLVNLFQNALNEKKDISLLVPLASVFVGLYQLALEKGDQELQALMKHINFFSVKILNQNQKEKQKELLKACEQGNKKKKNRKKKNNRKRKKQTTKFPNIDEVLLDSNSEEFKEEEGKSESDLAVQDLPIKMNKSTIAPKPKNTPALNPKGNNASNEMPRRLIAPKMPPPIRAVTTEEFEPKEDKENVEVSTIKNQSKVSVLNIPAPVKNPTVKDWESFCLKLLEDFHSQYSLSPDYCRACVRGAARIDEYGIEKGSVSAEQAKTSLFLPSYEVITQQSPSYVSYNPSVLTERLLSPTSPKA